MVQMSSGNTFHQQESMHTEPVHKRGKFAISDIDVGPQCSQLVAMDYMVDSCLL